MIHAGATQKKSGVRVSCRKGDPGERTFAEIHADGKSVAIYLDGAIQDNVVTADERDGMIIRYQTNDRGEVLLNPVEQCILEETVFGNVEVRVVKRFIA